jgi:uncharacterized protein
VEYSFASLLLALFAGLACGFLNTAASSGSAVSLPILILSGLDPVSANATNRVPVLVGALSAAFSFQARGAMPWGIAVRACVPASLGALCGALLAELLPARQLGLVITAAVLLALVLLFTKLKQAIEASGAGDIRLGLREYLALFGIGVWLGFIVLDGATYALLVLTLMVGLNLSNANAVKTAILIPTTLIAMLVFAWKGDIAWTLGGVMAAGSLVGGLLGARVVTNPQAKPMVFRLLVVVISAELVHLGWHYLFDTH